MALTGLYQLGSDPLAAAKATIEGAFSVLPGMGQAGAAAAAVTGQNTGSGGILSSVGNVASSVGSFFSAITSADFWERTIFIVLGFIFIAVALVMLGSKNQTLQSIAAVAAV